MPRIALGVEYNGRRFCGWQWQPGKPSVQSELEQALSVVADHPVEAVCGGRTDAGVHAAGQVVHFDTEAQRKPHSWLLGGNTHLPDDIRILWVNPVPSDFHARYSALARLYRYTIFNRPVRSALFNQQAAWCYRPLDAGIMHHAAQCLVGNHDFSSFRAQGCQSKSPFRIMHFIDVTRAGDYVHIDICANAFVHHMVRNIAGALLDVGSGVRDGEWLREVLALKQRAQAGITAPPEGLFFQGIFYPPGYGLDKHPAFDKLPVDIKRFD